MDTVLRDVIDLAATCLDRLDLPDVLPFRPSAVPIITAFSVRAADVVVSNDLGVDCVGWVLCGFSAMFGAPGRVTETPVGATVPTPTDRVCTGGEHEFVAPIAGCPSVVMDGRVL